MGVAVPMPDAGSQDVLSNARSQAAGELKGTGIPDPATRASTVSHVSISGKTAGAQPAPQEPLPDHDGPDAPPGAESAGMDVPPAPPAPPAPPTEEPSVKGFLKDEFKGTGDEVGNGIMRGFAKLGQAAAFLVGGADSAIIDSVHSLISGKDEHGAADAVFGAIKDYVEPAIAHWQATGETGGAAQILGHVTEAVPALALGPMAPAALTAQTAADTGKAAIDANQDATTATILAMVAATTTALGMKLPMSNPAIVKRIAIGMGINVPLTALSEQLTKNILNARGYREAAAKVDPTDPTSLTESGLMGAIFGVLAGKGAIKKPNILKPEADAPPGAAPPGPPTPSADLDAPTGAKPAGEPPPPAAPPEPVNPAVMTDAAKRKRLGLAPWEPIPEPRKPMSAEELKKLLGSRAGKLGVGATPAGPVTFAGGGKTSEGAPVTPVDANSPFTGPGGKGRMARPGESIEPQVPDLPSREPLPDLKAQIADLTDKSTPRKGVYLSKDNVDQLGPEGVKELTGDLPSTKNFDGKGGVMIFATSGDRIRAGQAKKTQDMQAVIGRLTGAGEGKTPDQTVVVQGQTPEGAVATEGTVAPHEVPAKVAEVQEQGKTPVVTTPIEAQVRRAALTAGDRVLMDAPSGQRAAIVAGVAKDGMVPVHLVDAEGGVSKETTNVKQDLLKGNAAPAETESAPPAKDEGYHVREVPGKGHAVYKGDEPISHLYPTAAEAHADLDSARAEVAGEPAAKPKAEPTNDDGAAAASDVEVSLAKKGHAEERPGDVMLGNNLFVSKADAMAAAREHMPPDQHGRPAQFGRLLNIAPRDWNRLSEALTQGETPAKSQEATVQTAPEATEAPKVQSKGEVIPDLERAQKTLVASESQKKLKGGLTDRIQNISGFAKILKAAAVHAQEKGIADEDAVNRATQAANAASKLGDKSTEEIAKGQGVGHTELTAHAKELLAAADQLQGRAAEAKAPEGVVKQQKLKARVAAAKKSVEDTRKAVAATPESKETVSVGGTDTPLSDIVAKAVAQKVKPTFKDVGAALEVDAKDRGRVIEAIKKATEKRGTSKSEKDVGKVSVIEDVPDEGKAAKQRAEEEGPLPELSKEQKRQLNDALEKYKIASEGSASYHRGNLERLTDSLFHPANDEQRQAVKMILDTATNARNDWHGKSARVEEPTDQDAHGIDYRDPTWGKDVEQESPKQPAQISAAARQWVKLHDALHESGMWRELAETIGGSRKASTHALLDHMLQHVEPGSAIHDLLSKLREHIPDHDVRAVGRVTDAAGGFRDQAAGIFDPISGSIQIALGNGELKDPSTLVTLVHEMVHGATTDFLHSNKDHPLSQEIARLRDVAEARLRAQHGDAKVQNALDVFNNRAARSADPAQRQFERSLYGLKNAHEFLTEALTNPAFQHLLAESELYARPRENLPQTTIMGKIVSAVRKILGIKRPDTARLLESTAHISSRIMEAQQDFRSGREPKSMADVYESLRDDDSVIRGESAIRDTIGDRAATVARDFYKTVRKDVIGNIRDKVLPLKSGSQLIRDGLSWFGHRDDAANPLRQYDEAASAGASRTNEIMERGKPLVEKWSRLSSADNKSLGEFMKDSTIWGIDPTVTKDQHAKSTTAMPKFDARYDEYQKRWDNLTPDQRDIYEQVRDFNSWAARKNRNAGIDTALRAFSDKEVPPALRQLLYSVKRAGEYSSLVGQGKLVDVGDRNDALRKSLETLAGLHEIDGPYFHLGRQGDYVVQINPEGVKKGFASRDAAEAHAEEIRRLSPESEATVVEHPDGSHSVEYKADYVSMHQSKSHAEAEAERLRERGFDVGSVTRKAFGRDSAPLSAGVEQLVSEVTRRLNRGGGDNAPLTDALRTTFVQMMAARSAYAGSKLMRKGTGGVKGEEMLRNWAAHTQSSAWGTGQLGSVFAKGEALGRVREAAKDSSVDQKTAYERGRVATELNARLKQETAQYGKKSPLNSVMAKLGFMNFLASPSHAAIWMTQNFTTAMPVAGARWGYGRTGAAFGRSMYLVSGPAFRSTIMAHIKAGTMGSHDIMQAVINAVKTDAHFGKWAQGDNSHLKQIMDRGAISTSFSNELGALARGDSQITNRVMDYARLLPHMVDVFNRVSTALAGLELTNGDVYKAADFVRETHMDYSGTEKSRTFKAVSRFPGLNSVTMFRTYTQGMAHLIYSNIHALATGEGKSRAEAAKTVAGVMLSTSILAGVTKGAVLEPARLAMYAWNKIFGDDDEFHDLDNTIDRFMSDHLGHTAGEAVSRGVPRLLGFDLSSRMGLGDLFFHDMPDLFSTDLGAWKDFGMALLGPMAQYVSKGTTSAIKHLQDGEPFQALTDIVPFKLLQDAMKAGQMATTGKTNDRGAQITSSSVSDAVTRVLGFEPASEAEAQERQRVAFTEREQMAARKATLLRQVAKQGYSAVASDIQQFNQANPSHRITVADFRRARTAAQRTENTVNGVRGRDQQLNEAQDY